ncbi:hypothetical protein KIN20_012360 [Parelaphostrongylus tenuis]|uniref:Uncharacterized protein n=1 Tax=Parelaphostrongylus tenuis TaxID=148309 RepID=A0AAD5QN38_PARTN|nr:hypothetical protein KIN20_012360 [Parelaphostrongylus tenuis]
MSFLLELIRYVNPRTWVNQFFGREIQVEYHDENGATETVSDHTENIPHNAESIGEQCKSFSSDEFLTSHERVHDDFLSCPELLNRNGEVADNSSTPDRTSLPSCGQVHLEEPGPLVDCKPPSKKRKFEETTLDGGAIVLSGRYWRRKRPRRSADYIDAPHRFEAENFATMSIPPTPQNSPSGSGVHLGTRSRCASSTPPKRVHL